MITLAVLLSLAAQAATAPPAAAPTATPANGSQGAIAIKRYFGCLREQTTFWRNDPAPTTHIDSVMAACDPLVEPAATEIAHMLSGHEYFDKIAASYKAKHGADLDLTPAARNRLREQGRLSALHILSGEPGQQSVNLKIDFDVNGVKP